MPSITPQDAAIIEVAGGVDTHSDTHTAAVIDQVGRVLGTEQFPADPAGYAALLDWMRALRAAGAGRGRGHRRLRGRAGPAAARPAGPGGRGRPARPQDPPLPGQVRPDRRRSRPPRPRWPASGPAPPSSATAASRRCGTCGWPAAARSTSAPTPSARSRPCIVTAPDDLRERLRGLGRQGPDRHLREPAARPDRRRDSRPPPPRSPCDRWPAATSSSPPRSPTWTNCSSRWWPPSTPAWSPPTASAPTSPASCWSPPATTTTGCAPRRRSPCSAAPPRSPPHPARPHRHRLNRGGDRQANTALYRVVICRLRWDPRTRAYMERRTKEGLSKKEIIRCLKRYIARELYQLITTPNDLELAA